MSDGNDDIPVDTNTGTASTGNFDMDPIDGSEDAGFQPSNQENEVSMDMDPVEQQHIDTSSSTTNLDWGQYEGEIDQLFIPEGGIEALNTDRALSQGTLNQLGNTVVKTGLGAALGVVENAGYLFDIEAHANTVTGVGNDYSNFVTEFASDGRKALDESFPVHRENPNQVFNLSDPAWWMEHGGGLVESVLEFAATGAGVGKVLGGGAKGLAMAFKNAKNASQIAAGLSGGATALTAMELAYVEGAMGGQQVYKDTYAKAIDNNVPEAEAKGKAAEAAGLAVQINTIVNTGLNVTGAKMFVRPMGGARKLSKGFSRQVGETLGDWTSRLKKGAVKSGGVAAMASEMGQESLEEVVNELATSIGGRKGEELLGMLSDEDKRAGILGTIIETLGKEETALSAILGAIGGGGQKIITSQMPNAKKAKEAELNHQQSQLNHVIDRVESFEAAQAKAAEASKNGDTQAYETALNEVFTTEAMSSIINGTEDQLSGIYDEIANMSPEEAKAQGYDVSNGPDNYRTRAQEAKEDIEKLSKDYENIVHKHNAYDTEAESVGYGQNVFYKHLNKYNAERSIDKAHQRLDKAKADHAIQNQRRGTDMGIIEAVDIQNDIKAKEVAISKIQSEIDEVSNLMTRSSAGRRNVLNKYGRGPKGTSRKQHVINKIKEKEARLNRDKSELEGILKKERSTFLENGGKDSEFEAALNETSSEGYAIQEAQAQIDYARESLADMDADYKHFKSEKGRNEYVESVQKENAADRAKDEVEKEDESKEVESEKDTKRQQDIVDKAEAAKKLKEEQELAEAENTEEIVAEEIKEPVVEPIEKTEQEVNTEIVEEGVVSSNEAKVEPTLADGDVSNISEKNKKSAYKTEESTTKSRFQVVEAAATFAYKSKDYIKDENGHKATATNEKSKDLHKELESSEHFQVGSEVTLEIDKTATWVDETTGKTWSYNDFVNGGVVDAANVPIAIKSEGETVAFIRTNNWITQKDNNGNYANVADDTDPDGPNHRNAEIQTALNLTLRNYVVNGGSVTTTITSKAAGTLTNNLVNGVRTKDTMSKLIPKVSTFAVVKNGQFHTAPDKGDIYNAKPLANSKEFIKGLSDQNGLVFVELITPNNKALMVPASIPVLNSTQVNTLIHVIEDKFTESDVARSAIFSETDLDVTTDKGLLDFARLFTHTMDESEANFEEKVNDETGNASSRYLNYSTKTGQLSFAKNKRGITTITSAEDFEAHKADLTIFLSDKLFSVRLGAINKPEGVSVPIVEHGGEVKVDNFDNYNEYIKTVLKTDVVGSEISETEDSYFDQPTIQFSQSFTEESPAEKTDQGSDTAEEVAELTDMSLLDNMDSIMGFDDAMNYEESNDEVEDFEMTDLKKKLLKEGLETFLVVDKVTNTPYNSYKQSQVVDSILELVARGMQKGLVASEAFKMAENEFVKRQNLYSAAEANFSKLTENQKRKLAISTVEDAQELGDEFGKVSRNWESFSQQTAVKLAAVFGIKKTMEDSKDEKSFDMLDGFEELESALEKVSFDDGATFQTNHKDTASARLKLFLALQESPTRTFLNLRSFIQFDTVYNELQMMLAGTEPNYDEFMKALYLKGATKPYTKKLASKLEASTQQVKNEFVTAFSKQYTKFAITLWNEGKQNGVKYLQMQNIEANRNDVIKRAEAQWVENQKSSAIVTNKGGKLIINPVEAAKFKDTVDALSKNPTVEGTQELLKTIGIDMPTEAVTYLSENSVNITGQSFEQHFKTGMFSHMSKALNRVSSDEERDSAESLLDLSNPLTGLDREGSSIKALATLTSQFDDAIYSNSHKDSEGKTIYSYSLNTALSHTVRELKANNGDNAKLDGLSRLSFSRTSHWGQQLRTNSKFRDSFDVQYLDGLSKRRSNQKGVKRNDQSDREMELQAMSLFQNQGRDVSSFIYPTISDKTTTPVISALRHDVSVLLDADGTYIFGGATKRVIHDLVKSEIDRFNKYKAVDKSQAVVGYDMDKNGNLNPGAKQFFLFPGLNEIVKGNLKTDGTIPLAIQTKMFAAAENHMKELASRTLESWEDLDIKTDTNLMFDQSYLNSIRTKVGKNATNSNLAIYGAIDMEINYMLANANTMQLISGDPATHFKKTVSATLNDYTKRLAKDIAPGLDGNFENTKYKVIFMNDKETDSQHMKNYDKVLKEKSSAYTGMEGTDAQEYTTLEEHLNVMNAYGKLSKEDFTRFQEMAKSGVSFSGKELDTILQPTKPVYVGSEVDFERDFNKVTYIKSSAFPLIKQLTNGMEIDKLRSQMEKHGIDRAAYVSAAKLGATKLVNVWDGDKMLEDFSLEGSAVTLDRGGFRIQQEVPYKEDKTKVLTVSQMNKLLFEGILEIEGMPELKARKEEIRKTMFENGKDKLLKSMGAKAVKSTTVLGGFDYVFEDLSKVKDVLIKEARDRNYPINDIQSLELTSDKKSFRIPIGFNASSKKLESVLMSLVTSNVLKQKLPGKSYVQGSSAGFLTGATKSKSWSELTDKDLGGIVFTETANMDHGLKFVREENGKVLSAQVIAPFYFRGENGKPLNIKDYTKEVNGKTLIDPDKIDKSLMNLIGARIPNQGHSSMLPIEIVGFLPESMGDLIIVPDEITKQMGSDFDVDKLYTYNAEYTVADGKITKNDGITNEYIDIHWSVLTHPEVLPRVLAPLDQRGEHSVAGEAELIHGIRSENALPESMLYRRNQQTAFIQNRGGKSGVGIFSLASTFNATIQDQNLYLGDLHGKKNVVSVFSGMKLNKLSGKGTNPVADKAAVISDMQSAAVDNAKEQTLDKLNLNDATFGAANAMAQLQDDKGKNLDIQYISRLLSQQVVLDYVKEFQKLSDSTVDNFVVDKEAEAFSIVREKYTEKAFKKDTISLNPTNMLQMIKDEASPNGDWYADQLSALEAFEKFNTIGSALTNIQSSVNSDSKGVSPSYFQVAEKIERMEALSFNPTIRGFESLLTRDTEVGYATEVGPVLAKALMENFLPQGSNAVTGAIEVARKMSGKDQLSADMKQRIFDGYKGFVLASDGWFTEDVDATRFDLLLDDDTPSLATRVKEAQATWGRDNFLLRRLMSKFSDVKGSPATIEYIASTGEQLDEQESIKAFVDMLASSNSETAQLAKDLVTYSYLTSGTQHATNFIKFIPTIYLNVAGLDTNLKDYSWQSGKDAYTFATQYVQNNPDFVPSMHEDMIKLVKGSQFKLPAIEEENEFSQYISLNTETEMFEYPKFLQSRSDNKYELYENIGTEDGEHVFVQIDTLGGKGGVTEYNSSVAQGSSLYAENQASVTVRPAILPTTKKSAEYENPNSNTKLLATYGFKDGQNKEEFMKGILEMSKESKNPSHRLLANILYKSKENLKDLTFKIDRSLPSAGRYSAEYIEATSTSAHSESATLTVNPSKEGIGTVDYLESVILHELIHGYTAQLIRAHSSGRKIPAGIAKSITSLDALRAKLYNNLSPEDKAAADTFNNLTSEEKDESKLTRLDKSKYYALGSTAEFITMTLADADFQRELNDMEFEGNKTMLDRFLDIVSNMFNAIATAAGIKVKTNSPLKFAIHESLNLLDHSEALSLDVLTSTDALSKSKSDQDIRSEFSLLNEKGKLKLLSYEQATRKALNLNTKNERFMKEYGATHKAKSIKTFGEKGDVSRTYYNIGFDAVSVSNDALAFGEESLVDPSVKSIMNRLDSRIRNIKRAMSESKVNKVAYQEKIDKLEKQKDLLESENSLKAIASVSKSHLDWATNILDKKKVSISELKEAEQIINVWRDVKTLFKDDYSGQYKEVLSNVSNRAEDLDLVWNSIAETVIYKEVQESSSRDVKVKDLTIMRDVSAQRAHMLDLSRVDNTTTQALDTWLKDAARDTNYEFTQQETKLTEALEKLEKTAEFKKNKFDIFLQKDTDKKWTGGLVNRYDQSWYNEVKKQTKNRDRKKDNPESWKKYFAWRKKNEMIVDSRFLFNEKGGKINDNVSKKHMQELISEFGESRAKDMVEQAKSKFMTYLEDLSAYTLSVENDMLVDSTITEADKEAIVRKWTIENSPKAYISNYKGQAIIKGVKMRGYKYTIAKPKQVVDGKKTSWYDKNFAQIEKSPELLEFYNFYRESMKESLSELPTYEIQDVQANFTFCGPSN